MHVNQDSYETQETAKVKCLKGYTNKLHSSLIRIHLCGGGAWLGVGECERHQVEG